MTKTVLIVDDSEMARNYHCYILNILGYEIITAIDGVDGLEKLLLNNVDAIISDINMPNMDGYTMVKKIRENEEYKNSPIIIITTEDQAMDKIRAFDAGADIYIVKPTEPEVLIEHIKLLLGD